MLEMQKNAASAMAVDQVPMQVEPDRAVSFET